VPLDLARMPSFIGYVAYCACAIQVSFLWCSKPEIKQKAHADESGRHTRYRQTLEIYRALGKYCIPFGDPLKLIPERQKSSMAPQNTCTTPRSLIR
jgi:hypothetical protein